MNMPEITHCLGMFPPKYGSFLISIFGLASGGFGIALIVLYSVAEENIIAHFIANTPVNDAIKNAVLMTIGVTSLLLVVSNGLLLFGIMCNSAGAVAAAARLLLGMCIIILLGAMFAPLSCFFISKTCIVKKVSTFTMVFGVLYATVFLELWVYFTVVVFNFEQEM